MKRMRWLDGIPSTGVKVKVRVAQQCLTLCDPMDYIVPIQSRGFSRSEYWSG